MFWARAFHFLPFFGQEFAEAAVGLGGFCMHCRFPARRRRSVRACVELGSESRGFERHVATVTDTDYWDPLSMADHAARGGAKASAKANGKQKH